MAHAQHNDSDTLFNGLHISRRVDKEMCTWRMRSIMTFIHFYNWRMRSNVGHLSSSGTRPTSWKTMYVVCAQNNNCQFLRMRSNVGHQSSSGTRSTSWKTMQEKLPSRSASFTPAQCSACTRNALTLPLILIELLQFG